MTDVLIKQTLDGGAINIEGGLVEMTGSFESAFYLALFGGNKDDDGSQNSKHNWWGNLTEENPDFHYRSKTQYLLRTLAPISGNLIKIEAAVKSDLNVFIKIGAVDTIEVFAILVDVRRVEITINIVADGKNIELKYIENWKAMERELS
jgi:phage gp46-like protein